MLKNLLLVFVALLCLYLYLHPRTETRVITQAAAPMVVRVPVAPTPVPRLYYHSPLDASAMSTSASTGTGYFSGDTTSRFSGGYYSGGGSTYGNYPVASAPVYYPYGGGSVSNNVTYNINVPRTGISALPAPVSRSYIAGKPPTYPNTANPPRTSN